MIVNSKIIHDQSEAAGQSHFSVPLARPCPKYVFLVLSCEEFEITLKLDSIQQTNEFYNVAKVVVVSLLSYFKRKTNSIQNQNIKKKTRSYNVSTMSTQEHEKKFERN